MGLETPLSPEGKPAPAATEAAPIESRAASPPREPDTPPRDLPDFAKKADDLEAIKKAVDDAASVGGGLWLSYLFVLFYLAVAAGAVTHKDLFLENPVKLPFLGVELPLLAFFFVAPILFIIVHAYTLVHLVFLTDKAKRFDQALYKQIGNDKTLPTDVRDRNAAIRAALRRQLPSNIFVQFLAGASDVRDSAFGYLLRAIAWVTLVVAPVLLLLMMQIQFLPFHSSFITGTQRAALLADLVLIWWLWRKILSARMPGPYLGPRLLWATAGVAFTLGALLFSWTVATFPGEWQEDFLAKWDRPRDLVSLHDWLFNSPVDPISRRRWLPLSSTLVLTGLNIYEALGIDDPKKVEWRDIVFHARGRDLKGALFDLASLPKIDFEGAQLQGASFQLAHLEGASLDLAQLQGASLWQAHLEGASLDFAQLVGASLIGAHLEGASLLVAQLQCASLDFAQLQGASLAYGQLQGASLDGTQLQGASLAGAQHQGASLQGADLNATDLSLALLWRSNRRGRLLGQPPRPTAIKLPDTPDHWLPAWKEHFVDEAQTWNDEAYQKLRQIIESIPRGALRKDAENRIQSLDCANTDPTLASCDPSAAPPPEAVAWRKALEHGRVDDTAYEKALASALKPLLCSGGDAAFILQKLTQTSPMGLPPQRFAAAGPEASALADFIMSKDCPASASLTNREKDNLLLIERDAEKAGK